MTRQRKMARSGRDTKDGQEGVKTRLELCVVCGEGPRKYKCSRCEQFYCSVACHKLHKENHPPDPEPLTMAEPTLVYEPIADATPDPTSKFSFLDNSEQMKHLCAKYPYLLEQLVDIGRAGEFQQPAVPAGLSSLPPGMHDGAARRNEATAKGLEALRKASSAPPPESDGIREYQELIRSVLGKDKGVSSNPYGLKG